METPQKEHDLTLPPADKVLFRKQVQRELDEIRQESEEAYALDNEIDLVPDSAYDDTYYLFEMLFDNNLLIPDIGWLINGGIGFEWRSMDGKGIGTMSIYGDKQVVCGASLGGKRGVKGTCVLSDSVLPVNFIEILKDLI